MSTAALLVREGIQNSFDASRPYRTSGVPFRMRFRFAEYSGARKKEIASAFGQVQGSLSWFINAYGAFANWKATVDRLTTFTEALEHARREADRVRMAAFVRENTRH